MKILSSFFLIFFLFQGNIWAWKPFVIENRESSPQNLKIDCKETPFTLTLTPREKREITPKEVPCRIYLQSGENPDYGYLIMPEETVAAEKGNLIEATKVLGTVTVTNQDRSPYDVELACWGKTTQRYDLTLKESYQFKVYKEGGCTLSLLKTKEELKIPELSAKVIIRNGKLIRH